MYNVFYEPKWIRFDLIFTPLNNLLALSIGHTLLHNGLADEQCITWRCNSLNRIWTCECTFALQIFSSLQVTDCSVTFLIVVLSETKEWLLQSYSWVLWCFRCSDYCLITKAITRHFVSWKKPRYESLHYWNCTND